jgi:hypothetical protein
MKKILMVLLLAAPILSNSQQSYTEDRITQFKNLNERVENLEYALRLQALVNDAVDKENYDLACKAQSEIYTLVKKANVRDMMHKARDQKNAYCAVKKFSLLNK